MYGDVSTEYTTGWLIQVLGDVMFRWVPATIAVVSGVAPDTEIASPILTPITEPITPNAIQDFLRMTAAPGTVENFASSWGVFVVLSVMASLLLLAGIIYCIIRIHQVRSHEAARFSAIAHPIASMDISKSQLRWNHIREQASSDNEQNWRLAILEADILLNELIDLQGYKGETMADKMKTVDRADWKTIDLAWEAHRARNAVAHQGMMQPLDSREVRRVIGLYEQVFKEFKFVE